ncbi:hypothetical protein KAR91_06630 [Candidatus Pacearchaeota archaeon]|nr:hypothetical protein [Candidatus Pacearchaeota archaeon]
MADTYVHLIGVKYYKKAIFSSKRTTDGHAIWLMSPVNKTHCMPISISGERGESLHKSFWGFGTKKIPLRQMAEWVDNQVDFQSGRLQGYVTKIDSVKCSISGDLSTTRIKLKEKSKYLSDFTLEHAETESTLYARPIFVITGDFKIEDVFSNVFNFMKMVQRVKYSAKFLKGIK